MRLKTKLVLAASSVTFAIVIALSVVFLAELLRQRIAQTAAQNDVMARQVLQMTRTAVIDGLATHPPADMTDDALHLAVADALRRYQPLDDLMSGLVRYDSTVQDVSVTDAHNLTLIGTDPLVWNQPAATRTSFDRVRGWGLVAQVREFLGAAHVLDVSMPLERNGRPFLTVHVGIRSTFLRATYVPWLKDALLLAVLGAVISMALAGGLAVVALRPIEQIGERLNLLTGAEAAEPLAAGNRAEPRGVRGEDAMVRVSATIDRLGRRMRSTEAGLSDLQTNLDRMLDTLRDGVLLFTAERRAVMVSDAVTNFVEGAGPWVGRNLEEIFPVETELGRAVMAAFERKSHSVERVRLKDGREVEFSLDSIDDRVGPGPQTPRRLGTLLTLRDTGSAERLERELEVSQRLAAIGRLTAGVGHEVKNPINAMVVHLELLRTKLHAAGQGKAFLEPTMRHVDILAGEMERLDRVVETLADFTRPLELHLRTLDLRETVATVVELVGAEMAENGVEVHCALESVQVRGDGELLQQALLNLVLNGMQAMPAGGQLQIGLTRMQENAVISVEDRGEGIPADVLPHIFDLYFTTKPRGSGIGLAMTYRIVQMHGGAIEVASTVGQGTAFTLRLPARAGELRGRKDAPTLVRRT